jgi:hypothetical protein
MEIHMLPMGVIKATWPIINIISRLLNNIKAPYLRLLRLMRLLRLPHLLEPDRRLHLRQGAATTLYVILCSVNDAQLTAL